MFWSFLALQRVMHQKNAILDCFLLASVSASIIEFISTNVVDVSEQHAQTPVIISEPFRRLAKINIFWRVAQKHK